MVMMMKESTCDDDVVRWLKHVSVLLTCVWEQDEDAAVIWSTSKDQEKNAGRNQM